MLDVTLSGIIICVVAGRAVRTNIASMLAPHPIRLIEADDGGQLLHVLKEQQVDCVLMDLQPCLDNGLLVQERMRQLFADAPPVIFLGTDRDDRQRVAKAFRSGASDYLEAGELSLAELLRSLRFAIVSRRRTESERAQLASLRKRSDYDELTGLYSQAAIGDVSRRMTGPSARASFTLLLIRNKQYDFCVGMAGAALGKQVMRSLAASLRKATRRDDMLGRLDDRTIVALLPTPDGNMTEAIVKRLTTALQSDFHSDELSVNLSVAIGSAHYPENGVEFDDLVRVAEAELARQSTIETTYAQHTGPLDTNGAARVGDRRAFPRHRVLKSGKIIVSAAGIVIDCSIRDMSEGGARLRLPGILAIPGRFDLVVADGPPRAVRCAWQAGLEAGVAFLERPRHERRGALAALENKAPTLPTAARLTPALRQDPQAEWLCAALKAIRIRLAMDAAFVHEFLGDMCMIREIDAGRDDLPLRRGDQIAYNASYCKRIVDGVLPSLIPDTALVPATRDIAATDTLPIGAHVGVPLKLPNGALFGTLCCVSLSAKPHLTDNDLSAIRLSAELVGSYLTS